MRLLNFGTLTLLSLQVLLTGSTASLQGSERLEKTSDSATTLPASDSSTAAACFSAARTAAVFSRRACEVFSKLRGMPMSYHNPVVVSRPRKRAGGSV